MLRRSAIALFALSSCGGPAESVRPFIEVVINDPAGFTSPAVDSLRVTTSAVLSGNPITDTFDVPLNGNTIPTDFVIRFSEQVRGQNVDIEIIGLASGVDVFSTAGSANAGTATIELTTEFCGDEALSALRGEQCDDGDFNSDITPNACRSTCEAASCGDAVIDAGEACDDGASNSNTTADACRLDCALPSCGDGVLDAGEGCDDSNNIDADGCEADCTLPVCGNGILDPEDFEGNLCYVENTPAGFTSDSLDIEVADMDGDGFQDVIFGDGSAVRVGFGNGTGGFSEIRTIGTTVVAQQSNISIVDFGNNGSLDISTSSQSGSEVSIFINQNQRNFSKTIASGFTIPTDHIIEDFDSDGRTDIIVCELSDDLLFIRGIAGGFAASVPISGFTRTGTLMGLELADINNDNNFDFIITESINNNNDSKLSIARGNGGGSFSFSSVNLAGISVGSIVLPNHAIIFDQDGDANKEIFVIDQNSNRSVIIKTLNGAVDTNVQPVFINTSNTINSIKSSNIDGDPLDDIILKFATDVHIMISVRNYEGIDINISAEAVLPDAIGVGDLDENGIFDIVLNESIYLFEE